MGATVASPAFSELVGQLTEALGQRLDAMRPTEQGFLLKTTDDFLYAFLEDPSLVSLAAVQRLLQEAEDRPSRLVVFSPGRLPLALTAEVTAKGATVVDGGRFKELVTGLNLGTYLGEEPRPTGIRPVARQLPSARQLDEVVSRARTWLDWGVPALSLRFYRQALELKPEFAPARNGVARSLLALGLPSDAQKIFREVLETSPDNLEARLGLGAVAGASGRPDEEIAIYRKLIEEDPSRTEIRAHLVAALIDGGRWTEVSPELKRMLQETPEDARLRFLHGAALEKLGSDAEGRREMERARTLGLDFDTERALCAHLGLPPPTRASSDITPRVRATAGATAKGRPPARRGTPRRGGALVRTSKRPTRQRKAK